MLDHAALAAAAGPCAEKHHPHRTIHQSVRRFRDATCTRDVLFPPDACHGSGFVEMNVIVRKHRSGLGAGAHSGSCDQGEGTCQEAKKQTHECFSFVAARDKWGRWYHHH